MEAERHPLLARLRERRERHAQRSVAYRVAFAGTGFAVVTGGIVLSLPLVPGPGIPLIAAGLAMLALEFDWAERLLERIVLRADRLLVSPRALLAVAAVVVAAVACAIAFADVPFLPV
ncbi:MAG TPA: PGPGW domain-containing protein [Gaiellaceae bacterium]|nr:PGPGW domain-containing protein [Gaiellaceae bacterium]